LHNHGGLDFKVLFCAPSEADRQYTVPQEFSFDGAILSGKRFPLAPKDWHSISGFADILERSLPFDMAVVAGSYFMPAAHAARRWLTRNCVPWYYWGENPQKKARRGPGRCVKDSYIRCFLRPAAGVLGVGTQACEAYQSLVGTDRPVFNLPYAPNLEPLLNPGPEVRYRAKQLRAGWGIDDPFVILFVGSLIERKAPDALLNAFAQCACEYPGLRLLFAGGGRLRGRLVHEAGRRGIADRVRFLGFVEGTDLYAAYHSADLFVLPTRTHEGWGVVVQEALAAGLPVLVSDQVGAGSDLVDEKAGRQFSTGSADSLVPNLMEMVSDPILYGTAASRARQERMHDWSSTRVVVRFVDFLRTLNGGGVAS